MTDPVRTCVGCRQREVKSELVRLTTGSDAAGRVVVVPDPRGVAPGRGAHLHPTVACYDLAVRRKAFARALRAPASTSTQPVSDYLASTRPAAGPAAPATTTAGPTRNWSSSS